MQKMQEYFSALRCPNTRHPWRNAKSAFMPSMAIRFRRRAYMDVFTASCQASRRTSTVPKACRSKFVHIPNPLIYLTGEIK